jgi:hypothetical protein
VTEANTSVENAIAEAIATFRIVFIVLVHVVVPQLHMKCGNDEIDYKKIHSPVCDRRGFASNDSIIVVWLEFEAIVLAPHDALNDREQLCRLKDSHGCPRLNSGSQTSLASFTRNGEVE